MLEPMSVSAMKGRFDLLSLADRHQESLAVANRALALYPENELPYVNAWVADVKLKMGDRLGAIAASRKAMPYGFVDLWTGLEYDWEFLDDFDPVRSAVGLVYIEEYDRIRQILIDNWNADDPDSVGANDLSYLVNRGTLEALAGDFESSIEFFRKSPVADTGRGRWTGQGHCSDAGIGLVAPIALVIGTPVCLPEFGPA